MANMMPPVKGAAFTLYFTLYKNDGTIIANPGTFTLKVSKDGAAVGDAANTVTEEDTTYGQCSLVFSTTEMDCDALWYYIVDNTSGCIPITGTIYTVSATRGMAGTALPNAAADAAGGLPISDAGALDLDAQVKTAIDGLTAAVITNAAGTDVAADIIALKAVADTIQADTDLLDDAAGGLADIHTDLGTLTTTVGVAGAGLTAITGAKLHADYDAAKSAAAAGAAMTLTAAYDAAKTAAAAGAKMDIVDAPNSTAVTAIQSGLAATGEAATAAAAVTVAGYAAGQSPADLVTGFSTHNAADVKTAVEAAGSHLTLVKAIADKLDTALEADAAVYRFTENALEQTPSGTSTGATLEEIEGSTVLAKEATVEAVGTDVDTIDAKVSALGAAVVTVTSPVSVDAETVTLVCGDDYYNADGRALTFTDAGGTFPAFTGGSCKFTVRNLATGTDTETAGTIVDANTVRFELAHATATDLWPAGGKYRFDVEVTLLSGHEVTIATGTVVMLAKYSG